jgi:hypothetical protein
MIQVRPTSILIREDDPSFRQLQREYEARHCAVLRQFLSPELVQALVRAIDGATFRVRDHPGIGVELCLEEQNAAAGLQFLTNDPALFSCIQAITGCGAIGCFEGRVYRLASAGGLYDSWHDDNEQGRMVGMSVNLSRVPYLGGRFQLRLKASGKLLVEIANPGPGDATLFRIAPSLEHRVTDVAGPAPRTAFAGWFRAEPDYRELLRGALRERRRRTPAGDGGSR